ncbi:hypothetical protein ABPG75_014083 [Micractinium tetrahymenae]
MPAHPEVRQTAKGLQVAFSHNGAVHLMGLVLTEQEADLVCDLLSVKAALDEGQPLGARRLRTLAADGAGPLLPEGVATELLALPLAELAQQLHACSQHDAWRLHRHHNPELAVVAEPCSRLLQGAAALGHRCLVRLLLALTPQVASPDSQGHSPLHAAARSGQMEVMQLLLSALPGLAAAQPGTWTPLQSVASGGSTEAVQLLLGAMPEQ